MPDEGHFGERLKQLRESRALNVTELAKRISVSPAAIWHWENKGTIPRSGTVDAIAGVLGVSRGFLETGAQSDLKGSFAPHVPGPNFQRATGLTLEELIRAIEAKGFDVSVRSRSSGAGSK